MKKELWIIIILVLGFLGFMMGYSLPPFMEVGFGGEASVRAGGAGVDEEALMQEYEKLYQDDDVGSDQ